MAEDGINPDQLPESCQRKNEMKKWMYGEHNPAAESEWPWDNVSPESQGIQAGDLERMVDHIEANNLAIHSIIIYKNGTIPFEAYFEPYDKDASHNMKSTSKGGISALVGIALRESFGDEHAAVRSRVSLRTSGYT